ncbi:unnamed protein product [Acanthoscelides obtectus]|uniref:Uncharacterized protein n=1 Tax=Acanthoscelides obtectus TaxID=200917 RepID=A0A9P0K9Q1_ACAOB|nr:unnamed protein product [Acanthoscelides obtectus]CAK1655986.1 Spermatogenesis-defective protein 39 homolog [Acanthoscelides obtectus]
MQLECDFETWLLAVSLKVDNKIIELCDVILYLKQTLKQNICFQQLSKWKMAVNHYAYYLIVNNHFQELADLYIATGATSNMRQLFYLIGKDVSANDVLCNRLEHVYTEHLQNFAKQEEKVEVSNNMLFLQWQLEHGESATSVIEQLAFLCRKELQKKNVALTTISEFKKQFKIDDYDFEWTVMNVIASLQMWSLLSEFFIKHNWFTKKQVFKTIIPSDVFVYGLSKHCSPKEVLEEYLVYTTSTEKSLRLAQKLGCHKFIIQYYTNQKDRSALIAYKGRVLPHSEEYFFIENAIQSLDKKWKN